jgi:hypothetical protein
MKITQCQRCSSSRVVYVDAHCSDACQVVNHLRTKNGYVPRDLGIGGGDDVHFTYCLECGQIQGKFPVPLAEIEEIRKG